MRPAAVIFDCDGVLVDTNGLNEANIRDAALACVGPDVAARFVDYFVSHNGLPREEKIAHFFPDERLQQAVLTKYNELNRGSLLDVTPVPEAAAFVEGLARRGIPLYVLSGGDEGEVRALLENSGLAPFFQRIMGGPRSKMDHVEGLSLSGRTCYFGDSRYDYEVAERFGFDFFFLSRHTQFEDWQSFFAGRPDVVVMHGFASLNPTEL